MKKRNEQPGRKPTNDLAQKSKALPLGPILAIIAVISGIFSLLQLFFTD